MMLWNSGESSYDRIGLASDGGVDVHSHVRSDRWAVLLRVRADGNAVGVGGQAFFFGQSDHVASDRLGRLCVELRDAARTQEAVR